MDYTTTTLLVHPTGGILELPAVRFTSDEAAILQQELTKLLDHYDTLPTAKQFITSILNLINSQQMPISTSTTTLDIPVHYLGYTRNKPTSWLTRLREALRILQDKPSQAYFTREDGEYADGHWRNAYRLNITAPTIRQLAPTAYVAAAQEYVIPIFTCVPHSYIPINPQAAHLLTPFMESK